jgi:hypothetical protein
MKGYRFDYIAVRFEAYKIECDAQNATLLRITPKPPWYSPRHYYNNYEDPKWLVPYTENDEHAKSARYRPASRDHCANKGNSKEIWSEAKKKATSYISNLSPHHNPL